MLINPDFEQTTVNEGGDINKTYLYDGWVIDGLRDIPDAYNDNGNNVVRFKIDESAVVGYAIEQEIEPLMPEHTYMVSLRVKQVSGENRLSVMLDMAAQSFDQFEVGEWQTISFTTTGPSVQSPVCSILIRVNGIGELLIDDVVLVDTAQASSKIKEVTYDSEFGKLPVPYRDGFTFDGWFSSETGGTQITSETIVAFYMYISKLFNPLQALAEQFHRLQSATRPLHR